MPGRREVVSKVLELMPGSMDAAQAEIAWFCDIRRQGGWRLTESGLSAFDLAGIQRWRVPLDTKILNKFMLLAMNRRIKWPYFISVRTQELHLFSDRDAVTAMLYGDLEKWIQSLRIVK